MLCSVPFKKTIPLRRDFQFKGADVPDKSPETYSALTYLWVFGLAALGGAVSFIRKIKLGHARVFNVVEFIGEIFTSAFAGVLTFYLCEWSSFSQLATAAFVGIAGHMGSRAIFMLEKFFEAKFPRPIHTGDSKNE